MTQREILIGASLVAGAALLANRAKKKKNTQSNKGKDLPPDQAPAASSFNVLRTMANPGNGLASPVTSSVALNQQWGFTSPVEEKTRFNERLRFDYQRKGVRGRGRIETQPKVVLSPEGSVPPPPPPLFGDQDGVTVSEKKDPLVSNSRPRPTPSFYPTAEDILSGVPEINFEPQKDQHSGDAGRDELGVPLPNSTATDWEAELARYQRDRALALAAHAKIASEQVGQGLYSPQVKKQPFPRFRSSSVLTGGYPASPSDKAIPQPPTPHAGGFVPKIITADGVTGVAYDLHTGLLLPDPNHPASVALFEANVRAVMTGADPGQINDQTYQLITDKSVF